MEATLTMRISIEINSIDEDDYERQKDELVQYLEDKGFSVITEAESIEDPEEFEFDDEEELEDDPEDEDLDDDDDEW